MSYHATDDFKYKCLPRLFFALVAIHLASCGTSDLRYESEQMVDSSEARRTNGTGLPMAENEPGQLLPASVAASSGTWSIAAGMYHSLVKRPDGTVWAWGYNLEGQLGQGNKTLQRFPVQVLASPSSPLPAMARIDAAGHQSFGLTLSGEVWAWGQNISGQLGTGDTSGRSWPAKLDGFGRKIIAIAAGTAHTLALDEFYEVWAWGNNGVGQLGTNDTRNRSAPVLIGLDHVMAIAAGKNHSLAIRSDGTVWVWGSNADGQLGDSSLASPVSSPSLLENLPPTAVAIAAGGAHSLAVLSDGSAWAWGNNTDGQLGLGTAGAPEKEPVEIPSFREVVAISAGGSHSLARTGDGKSWAWGSNRNGRLGNGTTVSTPSPTQVKGLTGDLGLAAGQLHSLAVGPACPALVAWGANGYGQLGDGTTVAEQTLPVVVPLFNTFYRDKDGDGFGDSALKENKCVPSPGYVENRLDCNDSVDSTFPGAPERCDGQDNNCNGAIDEGNPEKDRDCPTGMPGVCALGKTICDAGKLRCIQKYSPTTELCDGRDNNCDGTIDDGNPGGTMSCATGKLGVCAEGVTWCYGGSIQCVPTAAPSSEVCDNLDNNCNGSTDEGLSFITYYKDTDGDGWGDVSFPLTACAKPAGYALVGGDCNDKNDTVNPGTPEICNGIDDNCNGSKDEGLLLTYYRDYDGDGWGSSSVTYSSCTKPEGYVAKDSDCNDRNSRIHPGAADICNGINDDCDDLIDEDDECVCVPGQERFCGPTAYSWVCAELCSVPPLFPIHAEVSGRGSIKASHSVAPVSSVRSPDTQLPVPPSCMPPKQACKQYLKQTCNATGHAWGPCL